MKRTLLGLTLSLAISLGFSQTSDSVSINPGYANHTWYSLENGTVSSASKTSWDLGFEISGFTASILVNHVKGVTLWSYPNGDTSAWNTIDTAGISSWSALYNSDTSWNVGAFNVNMESNNAFDLGWGVYNMTTHHIVGDSLYILLDANGNYHKLWVESLASGTYTFKTADLDGNNETSHSLAKSSFVDKNFGYFDLATESTVDVEPLTSEWDLLFTQYAAIIPGYGGYPSTGVLLNKGVRAAAIYPIAEPDSFDEVSTVNLQTAMNTIGYNWKSINMSTFEWEIQDSLAYIIQKPNGDYWRVVFTGFGGSANGNYYFNKEKIETSSNPGDTTNSVSEINGTPSLLKAYPNPSNGVFTLAYDFSNLSSSQLSLVDLNGKTIQNIRINNNGLSTQQVTTNNLASGIYFLQLQSNEGVFVEKLMIK